MATATASEHKADDAVKKALRAMLGEPLAEGARGLLGELGYKSGRVPTLPDDSPETFVSVFEARNAGTKSEREFVAAARAVSVLFQVTDGEIAAQAQGDLFDAGDFSEGNARSFIFAAAQLKARANGLAYSRGHYARFAREINKRIAVPVAALFRTEGADEISVAFVGRRESKVDAARDVLERVSMIRGISLSDTHTAHIQILRELSLNERLAWMDARGNDRNFDGLLDAWLAALDTDALTDKFYKDLFRWFQRAVKDAKFPTDQKKTLSAEEHVIRLITRILFVWFIKEKGLVSGDLFIENKVKGLLKDYDAEQGDSYYRAVLQNLFFATLNTEIGRRGFSGENNATHRDFSRWRYRAQIADPDALTALFKETPFINGGLFDCMDSEPATSDGGYRIDCFSDNKSHYSSLSIPNRLFFDGADGLIALFDRYKFTVEENTPLEQEVALDPELLGNVFENLLAAYNPETADTARRRTGSYYTPRAVVDYMVDESLAAALAEKVAPDDGDKPFLAERLRYLLDYGYAYEDAAALFSDDEREAIVTAVAALKIIDPAVGSGAFPMGILHKLTLALRRIDPDNARWERLQKRIASERAADAFDTPDQAERDAELAEISHIFQRYRDSDFGRKLYLIQNSIYGVDIQPVAIQIAKLRFFISLAIEQDASAGAADNYGIRPLPNLETRFVAANTLIGLRGLQGMLPLREIDGLQRQLRLNRERHFHAGTRQTKLACRDEDLRLRDELQAALQKYDFPAADAAKIAKWDAFDQNALAVDWFDAKYMFGVESGFDVVIGNPPYIYLRKSSAEFRQKYKDAGFATYAGMGDIYQLFYEKGVELLTPDKGLLAYITSNSWLKTEYGKSTRRMFAESHTPLQLVEMGKDVFQNAIVDSAILLARSGKSGETAKAVDMDKLTGDDNIFPPDAKHWVDLRTSGERAWVALPAIERGIMDKIEAVGTPLADWALSFKQGIQTGLNDAFIIDGDTRDALIAADPKSAEIIKPVLRGRDIQKYKDQWAGLHLICARKGININRYPEIRKHLESHRDRLERRGGKNEWYELQISPSDRMDAMLLQEKLVWMDLSDTGRFAYDDSGMFCVNTVFMMTGDELKYLCGVLNSSLIAWYMGNTSHNSGMGVPRWIPVTVGRIPVPRASAGERARVAGLVDAILAAKATGADGDAAALEGEVDGLVGGLYGLGAGEMAGVWRSLGVIHATDAAEDAALLRAMEAVAGEGAVDAGELDALFREWDADTD